MLVPSHVAIEGPVAVGKTQLANALAERLKARLILEDVTSNPYLAEFNIDSKRFAFQAEVNFLINRFNQQESLIQGELFSQVSISDYIFSKSRIFASLTLTDQELLMFDRMYELLDGSIAEPDIIVYLQAPVDTLMQRVQERDLPYESHINDVYLGRLSRLYHQYFQHYDARPVIHVDVTAHDITDSAYLDTLIEQMEVKWNKYVEMQRRIENRSSRHS